MDKRKTTIAGTDIEEVNGPMLSQDLLIMRQRHCLLGKEGHLHHLNISKIKTACLLT
ncbi:MAG: hypothetical protein LPK26_12990 [Bacillaceae bacterium]|nr:hypothetical protein [Bacillaceae bacterium]